MASQPDERRSVRSGVVHVGANTGQEIPHYIRQGLTPVLAFEPLPDVYQVALGLYHREISQGLVHIHNVALGDVTSRLTLTVALDEHGVWDTPTASAFGGVTPEAAQRMGWMGWLRDYESKQVDVACWRFHDWLNSKPEGIDFNDYGALVVDVQGMELEVLKGFEVSDNFSLLSYFASIIVECSEVPIYAGGAPGAIVCQYLIDQGFEQVSPLIDHGDVKFLRT